MSNFRFSHNAMATIFELIIVGSEQKYFEEVAWELWKEIDILENELSRYNPNSDISKINGLKRGERIVLGENSFNCIRESIELYNLTQGAFNIASGSLYNCWLNSDKSLINPTTSEIEIAARKSDISNIILYDDYSVEIKEEGTIIDLGAFGKGYSLDKGYELLKEWEVKSAFLSSGQSSIRVFSNDDFKEGWKISISNPNDYSQKIFECKLRNISIGGSGLNKGFHIIDARKGKPIKEKKGVWVFADSAAIADALSTAFMILDEISIKRIISLNNNFGVIIVNSNQRVTEDDIMVLGKMEVNIKSLLA